MPQIHLTQEPGDVWVPNSFIRQEADQFEETLHAAVQFRRLLQAANPRLDLRWGGGPPWPIHPRWYIVMRDTEGLAHFWVIQTPEGEYCEPEERHLNRLRESDLEVNPRLIAQIKKRQEDERIAALKRGDDLHRQFRERLNEALGHLFDSSMPVSETSKRIAEGGITPSEAERRKQQRLSDIRNRRLNRKQWG